MKKKLFLFFCCVSFLSKTYPLTDTAVRNSAIITGAFAGAGGTGIAVKTCDTGSDFTDAFIASTTGVVSGVSAGFLTYWYLNKYHTPFGRYKNSLDYVEKIQNDGFFSDELEKEKDLITYVNSVWTSRWPLVSAKNHLSYIKGNLLYALDNLKKAINELKKKDNKEKKDKKLLKNCITLISLLPDLIKTIQDRISIIISDKNYNFQMNLFHQHEEHKKQMQHEAIQFSLNRLEQSKNRWSKEKIAKEQMQHQTNLMNNVADVLTSNNNNPVNDSTVLNLYNPNSHYWQQDSGLYPDLGYVNTNYDPNYGQYDYGYAPSAPPEGY